MTKWILYGYEHAVIPWFVEQVPDITIQDFKEGKSIAIMDGNEIICAVVYNNFYEASGIQMSVAALPGRKWAYPQFLGAFFTYPFVQLGVRRVTSVVSSNNAPSRNLALRLGFQDEGTLRKAGAHGEDLHVMGLLKHECRYLEEGSSYGKKQSYASSGT